MKKLTVVNMENGERTTWNAKNVKSYASVESINEMRAHENHERFYFMVVFKGLEYDMAMYEVDKYDLEED